MNNRKLKNIFDDKSSLLKGSLLSKNQNSVCEFYNLEKQIAEEVFKYSPGLLDEYYLSVLTDTLKKISHMRTTKYHNGINLFDDYVKLFEQLHYDTGNVLFNDINQSFVNGLLSRKYDDKISFVKKLLSKGYKLTDNTEVIINAIVYGDKELFNICLKSGSPVNHKKLNLSPLFYKSLFAKTENPEEQQKLTFYFWDKLIKNGANINAFQGHEHYLIQNSSQDNKPYFQWLLNNNADTSIKWTDNLQKEHSLRSFVNTNCVELGIVLDKFLLTAETKYKTSSNKIK